MSTTISFIIETLIHYRRLVFSVVLLFIAVGLMALSSMARQEDPSFPYRAGLVKVFYLGGTPTQIEKLITEPLEEEFAQVAEIDSVRSTSRDDLAIFNIELQDYVYDTDAAWDRVKDAIERARLQFPQGVNRIEFDDRQIDMPAVVLSLTGSDDPILLEEAALKLKQHIIGLEGISRIEIEGAPEKEVIISLDQKTISRLGLSRQAIADTIAQRNSLIPGGLVSSADKSIRLNTQSDYDSLAELGRTMLRLPSGQLVSLESIAEIRVEPRLPLASQVFQDGKRAVSLGIIAQRGQVDIVAFGDELRNRIDQFRTTLAPIKIEESFFQPDYVQDRLDGLGGNLIISVLIIALIVFFAMGWRTGLLVSAVLPVVSIITLGLYSIGGGVFHQMAVIGIVISLGILIDNAIVVIEYIETAIRKGVDLGVAIRDSIRVMAKPLMASTGTTVAAFIPLLLAKGGVGDFTRAVPTMVVTAMIVSYLISILTLPLIAFYWVKAKQQSRGFAFELTDKIAQISSGIVTSKPRTVLLSVALLLTVSASLAPFMKLSFFPSTDRAQIVIDMEMPSNTPLAVTSRISKELEQKLSAQDSVTAIYRYVGGAGFRFYYNMGGAPNESHVARFTVNTRDEADNQKLVDWVREELKPMYPDITLIPQVLGQGPPRPAPIEIRVKHPELEVLHTASQQVKAVLQSVPGVTELRSNLDLGTPELQLSIQDAAALSYGLQPNQIASAVFAESRGLSAGQFRYDTDPIPIRVRSSDGQNTSIEVIENQYVYDQQQSGTPLSLLAGFRPAWTPTTLRHHNYGRTVTVLSQIKPGYAFNQVLAEFNQKLSGIELAEGVIIELGGDAAASSKSNSSIAASAPIAIGLLIFFMMFQFNSFRRIGIVFVSIPLAAVGVIPGLVFSGQPFGFQSLLGVIALIGIVVNNAIVLIDVVDQSLNKGEGILESVKTALEKRTAPILLTTATTIFGLLPLALSSSTLWPPMAWAIISGLLLSTMLTLVAIPALCVLLLGRKQDTVAAIRLNPSIASVAFTAAALLMFAPIDQRANAAEVTSNSSVSGVMLDAQKIIQMSAQNLTIEELSKRAQQAEFAHEGTIRSIWFPKLSIGGEYSRRDDISSIILPDPFGALEVADDSSYVYETKLSQTLFDPASQKYGAARSLLSKETAKLQYHARSHQITGRALKQYFQVLTLQEQLKSLVSLESSLTARVERIQKQLSAGRALKTDLLQVEVALNRAQQEIVQNKNTQKSALSALRSSLNLSADASISLDSDDVDLELPRHSIQESELDACFSRKDCRTIELALKESSLQLKQLNTSYLPRVNLSLADRRSDGQLFVADKDQRAMLEFSWNLFSGGERLSQRKALKAQLEAVELQLGSFQQALQVELDTAHAAIANADALKTLAQSSVALDEERLRLSRKRYESGLLNIDELLDAEASLARSQSDLATAKVARLSAIVDKHLATGEVYPF